MEGPCRSVLFDTRAHGCRGFWSTPHHPRLQNHWPNDDGDAGGGVGTEGDSGVGGGDGAGASSGGGVHRGHPPGAVVPGAAVGRGARPAAQAAAAQSGGGLLAGWHPVDPTRRYGGARWHAAVGAGAGLRRGAGVAGDLATVVHQRDPGAWDRDR